jgi:uncharacterized protein (TIGR03000 family)
MYSIVLMMALTGSADAPALGHHGCGGCCGGCYGCSGCYGCCGGCYGGGYVYSGCYGSCYGGCWGGYMMPAAPAGAPEKPPEKMPKPTDGKDKKDEASVPAPATIVVSLPADAKLAIDDHLTASTSEARVFVSPELAPGKDFTYTLKAEIMRDGQKLTATERVSVRAGQETRVSLNPSQFAAASVAQK